MISHLISCRTLRRTLPAILLLLSAPGAVAEDADWAVALGKQLQILEKEPDNRPARQQAWRAAMRLGLYEEAAELAAQLDEHEQRAQEGDRIALKIRHGIIDRNTLRGPDKFLRLDAALTASDQLAHDFLAGKTLDAEDQRRLTDRLSALANRRRALEAIDLYENFVARGLQVPIWTRRDIAGSYLEQRLPQQATRLYDEVVSANPDDFEANLGLFYALVESEELDAATQQIDAFTARLPERRNRDGKYNGERLSSEIAADQARLYSDRLKEAQARIVERNKASPFNSEARQSSASLALARGWPHQGEQLLLRVAGSDPGNPALHADLAETRLSLQNWPAAQHNFAQAQALDAEHGAVKRAAVSFDLHQRYELSIDAAYGQGDAGNYFGSRDWHVDTWLYSRPISENWRLFFHNYTAKVDFDGSKTDWIRNGAGAEWRWLNWRLTGEVNGGSNQSTGLAATARWKPDDYWTLSGAVESRTNEIPLRAVRDGVYANQASLNLDWRANESRKLALGTSFTDFSDTNQRSSLSLAWHERWFSGPRWMFETALRADASHNTLASGFSYFNPKNDRSAGLTVAVEQLGWRNYEYAFRQRLALTAGRYWQLENNLQPGTMQAIEYGHRWELDRDLSLRYHLGRSLRPYDGVREGRSFANLSLLWRF